MSFFDINNIFFTLLNYPMSYLEFFGTLLNLWSVYLVSKNHILSWPIGIVAVVLFGILFFQINLYSDVIEQIYFFITGFYGWWEWKRQAKSKEAHKAQNISPCNRNTLTLCAFILFAGTWLLGWVTSNLHIWLPNYITDAASYAYLDAFTTIMSFVAMILMAKRKLECWMLWISVDVIGIWLYFIKDVVFVSLLYAIFLVLASKGLYNWRRLMRAQANG